MKSQSTDTCPTCIQVYKFVDHVNLSKNGRKPLKNRLKRRYPDLLCKSAINKTKNIQILV